MSDRRSLGRPFAAWLAELAAAGVEALLLREKDLSDRELLRLAETARAVLLPPRLVLVSGRIDIALAAGCNGAHVPSDGVPIAALRRRFPRPLLLGCSTHRPEEVAAAQRDGADYVTFGPLYPTPSKAAYGPPPGLAGLREATRYGLPVLALGGIDAHRVEAVATAGAQGVAGIRVFQSPEPLRELLAAAGRCWPADDVSSSKRTRDV